MKFTVGEYVRILIPLGYPSLLIGNHNGDIGCITEICPESTLNDTRYHLEFEGCGHVGLCCLEETLSEVTND